MSLNHKQFVWVAPCIVSACAHGAAIEVSAVSTSEATSIDHIQTRIESFPSDSVVHRFDFDERSKGNLEDLPKYWEPFRPPGFPQFAVGSFDPLVGHAAPPSFHLSSSGRNIAYQYAGPETPVRPDAEYRIEAFIRPDHLQHARVCLSAHFVDSRGEPLLETIVRTSYLGDTDRENDWVAVDLYLPPAPDKATTIGLIAWVLQESTWNTEAVLRRHISPIDVHAGAWLDDITIYRLPQARLTTDVPGNVLTAEDPRNIHIVLADSDERALAAQLEIIDAEGQGVVDHLLSTPPDDHRAAIRVSVASLNPGFYRAKLSVQNGGKTVLSRSLDFLLLPPRLRATNEGLSKSFGVVIDPRSRVDRAAELELLRRQSARSVKLPIWTGVNEESPDYESSRATERFLRDLAKDRFLITGVLWGPPSAIVRSHGAYQQPLVDLLAGSREGWENELATEAAPAASVIHWWQIEPDGETVLNHADSFATAVAQFRDALQRYITVPRVSAPIQISDQPDSSTLPVEQFTVSVPSGTALEGMGDRIHKLKSESKQLVSSYVSPLSADLYDRQPRFGEWAQRLIAVRHAGADVVYTPQMWRSRATAQGMVTEPIEEYLVLHTIGEILANASPGPTIRVADGIHCKAFELTDTAVLAVWDDHAPPEGRNLPIQLGQARRQIDLWGHSSPLSRDDAGRHQLRVSPTPVFVDGVETWLVELMNSVSFSPSHVESGTELVRHQLEFNYRGSQAVTIQGVLVPPEGIEVSPRTFALSVRPGQPQTIPIEVRYAHNAPAGRKDFVARLTLLSPPYILEIPLSVDLGLSDIEVSGSAVVEHGALILSHVIRNHSSATLSFRSTAVAPGRERQYRPITNLAPDATQTVEYRFHDGTEFVGRHIYLALRELNDGPRQHNLQLTVP